MPASPDHAPKPGASLHRFLNGWLPLATVVCRDYKLVENRIRTLVGRGNVYSVTQDGYVHPKVTVPTESSRKSKSLRVVIDALPKDAVLLLDLSNATTSERWITMAESEASHAEGRIKVLGISTDPDVRFRGPYCAEDVHIPGLVQTEVSKYLQGREAADGRSVQYLPDRDAVVSACTGMFLTELYILMSELLHRSPIISAREILRYRARLHGSTGVEIVVGQTDMDDLIGHDALKQWIKSRRQAVLSTHWPVARPRGVLLYGPPGTGKSMACQAIASHLGLPLLRLSFSDLMSKWVGETEKTVRTALSGATAASPCVVWVDEIDKALASSNSSEGTLTRVLGMFLEWMSNRPEDATIFVVASANSLSGLPPELLRPGRFDTSFELHPFTLSEAKEFLRTVGFGTMGIQVLGSSDVVDTLAASLTSARPCTGAILKQVLTEAVYISSGAPADVTLDALVQSCALVSTSEAGLEENANRNRSGRQVNTRL